MPIHILIADDHPVVRAGLQTMLSEQADFKVIGQASNGEEAIRLAMQMRPDVVIMDLRMAHTDGIESTRQIKRCSPDTAVLILTTYNNNADILRAVEAGALGYLLKDALPEQLFAAIRSIAHGKSALAPDVATQIIKHMQAPATTLSERELAVLTLVAHGASNKEAARSLHISEATIKTHLIRIFTKLGVADRTAAVTVAIEYGLLHLQ